MLSAHVIPISSPNMEEMVIETQDERRVFLEAAREMAKNIREGSLHSDARDPLTEVHKSSYEPLARINDLGLITVVSQDALDSRNGEVKRGERSFVSGFMLPREAGQLVDKINLLTDMVGFRAQISEGGNQEHIIVSRTSNYRSSFRISLTYSPDFIDQWKRNVGGFSGDIPAVLVTIFDAKWGRSATSRKGLFNSILLLMRGGR